MPKMFDPVRNATVVAGGVGLYVSAFTLPFNDFNVLDPVCWVNRGSLAAMIAGGLLTNFIWNRIANRKNNDHFRADDH